MFCGIGELGAAVDLNFTKASKVQIEELLNTIYETKVEGVTVHEVGASFGDVDATAYIKTSLDWKDGHPTWRIAQWVEKVFNMPNVTGTRTRILIHDPGHSARERERAEAKEVRKATGSRAPRARRR